MIRRQKTGKWLTRHSREGYFDSGSDTKDQKEKSAKKSQGKKTLAFFLGLLTCFMTICTKRRNDITVRNILDIMSQ
jgi:hypothetical protein